MFEPALKIPVANARSRPGNHSATVLIDAGKLPDSPRPSANLAALNPSARVAGHECLDLRDTDAVDVSKDGMLQAGCRGRELEGALVIPVGSQAIDQAR